jgi:beta-galactosidase
LDTIINNAEQVGLYVMLGTPTATMPAWILGKATDEDEIVLKGPDSPDGYEGSYAGFGGRRQYSFNSATYLQYAERITFQVANRYGNRNIVKFWQVES